MTRAGVDVTNSPARFLFFKTQDKNQKKKKKKKNERRQNRFCTVGRETHMNEGSASNNITLIRIDI